MIQPQRYFDHAATAPMWPEALQAYVEAAQAWPGNPSSLHDAGSEARQAYAEAKEAICHMAGCDDGRLLVTSGGTESNNLVITSLLAAQPRARILLGHDVHPSLWFATRLHRDRCDIIRPAADGRIGASEVLAARTDAHALVCLSHACNETGIVHQVEAIAGVCSRRKLPLLIDGTQALGHLDVDLRRLECEYYTFSAHKFGGPRGLGGLFVRSGDLRPSLHGGNQEWRLRAGTENLAGLCATRAALQRSLRQRADEEGRLRRLAQDFLQDLRGRHPGLLVNSRDDGLPGLVSISVPGANAHNLAVALNLQGFAVSTGSACHADQIEPSRVILGLGRSPEEALGTLRVSFGPATTAAAVAEFGIALSQCIQAEHLPEKRR